MSSSLALRLFFVILERVVAHLPVLVSLTIFDEECIVNVECQHLLTNALALLAHLANSEEQELKNCWALACPLREFLRCLDLSCWHLGV